VEIIRGFTAAAERLSRENIAGFGKISPRVEERLQKIFGRPVTAVEAVETIIRSVRERGDQAVREYTLKIDGFEPPSLEISKTDLESACRNIDKELFDSLKLAAERIEAFHQSQKENIFHGVSGQDWGQITRPLKRVGLYSPGGTAVYPSAVLMTAIPAKVAGVKEIILTTPPRNQGSVPAATLAAAYISGVDRVFAVGGAQAVAALACGTETIPRVDKICGPGNVFVMLAKKSVFGTVDIDALQGPSEILIIADQSANPGFCAADMIAQAEHDILSEVVLVTTSESTANDIKQEIEKQLSSAERKQIAGETLKNNGVIAIVDNLDEAVKLSDLYAPEHLELLIENAESYIDLINNAGCIFVGEYSPVPMGDYIAGPNHSLPTGGTARFSSPLNICDYVKFIDVVKLNKHTFEILSPHAVNIARAEGLYGHARAIEYRFKKY
jgi:histidinol dehydrogenase